MRWTLAAVALLVSISTAGCVRESAPPGANQGEGPPETLAAWRYTSDGTLVLDGESPPPSHVVLTGYSAPRRGEPSIASTSQGTLLATAWDFTLRSDDGGATWNDIHDFDLDLSLGSVSARMPGLTGSGDPYLWYDAYDSRVYVDHLFGGCNSLLWSDDEGDNWQRRDYACTTPFVDHQKLASGPPGPMTNPLAPTGTERVMYLCYNKVATSQCAMSYDRGTTWPLETTLMTNNDETDVDPSGDGNNCGTINGQPAVRDDGIVVVPRTLGCTAFTIHKSTDSGLTWSMHVGPASVGAEGIDPDVAFAPDGTLYALWQGSDHLKYVASSPDAGESWTGPWVASPPHVTSTEFQTIAIDESGRIGLAYLGTNDTNGPPGTAADDTRWHLFITTMSMNQPNDPVFATVQATREEDPVQVGCTSAPFTTEGYVLGFPCENLGEFIDSDMHPDGTYYVAFTDGCVDGCAGNPDARLADSQATEIAVAWLPPS